MKEVLISSPEAINKIDALDQKVDRLLSILEKKEGDGEVNDFVTSEEARQMLGVSKSTWQTMRNNKRIPYSQVGRKIYVKRQDIIDYLNNHRVHSEG